MTKEELKNKAKEFVSEIASGTPQEMDYYANLLVEFANETTKELEKENTGLKIYNEKLLDGDIEKHNKIVELQAQIEKMKCCEICGHNEWGSCNYHPLWENDCKENGLKLFELKEIKEK